MHIALSGFTVEEETVFKRPPSKLGKYHVLELIGEGSMGRVFLGRDPVLERDVAIKVMAGAALRDARMRERFEREAKSVARLHHPNIVTVHDLGYDEEGLPFIAMELLCGETLEAAIEAASLTLSEKLDAIAQVCRGLAHAHANGIVHRDIKPANVFLSDDGTAKVMDFGVARWTQTTRTQAGLVVGTAGYMSPEQLRGKPVDGRADIFSLGVVFYELLTHQLLYSGDTLETIFFRTLSRDTPRLALADGTPVPDLQSVLDRALARDADARFATAEEMGSALARLVAGGGRELQDRNPLLGIEPSAPAGRTSTDSPRRRSSQPTLRLPRPSDAATEKSVSLPTRREPPRPRRASSGAGRRAHPHRRAGIAGVAAGVIALALGIVASRGFSPEPLGLGAEPPSSEVPAPPPSASEPVPALTPPSEPAPDASPPGDSLVADAALALAAGRLHEAESLVERGELLAPEDGRWESLREQLRARRAEIARRARAADVVQEAAALLAAGDTDGAIAAYERAARIDPENAEARSGLERARSEREAAERRRARAATPTRRFVESRTDYRPPAEGGGELLGFESEAGLEVKETADPFFPAQVVIEMTPPDAQPGEPYVLRVRLFNEGYRPLAVRDVTLVSVFDGKTSGRGQALPVRVSRVEPRATALLYEATGTWKETYASGSIEAVVALQDGGELRKSVRW